MKIRQKATKVNVTSNKTQVTKIIVTIILFVLGIVMLMPFFWMISTSFKFEIDVFSFPMDWIPVRWNFNNYKMVFSDSMFPRYFLNSMIVTALSVTFNVLFSSMAGYAFARLTFKGSELLFLLFLSTMMIPSQVLLVPKYILFRFLHISDTHLALILPAAFGVFSIFLFRQSYRTIPREFTEAAKIDGAGPLLIFGRIITPMIKPTILTVTLLQFTESWNDYINPKTYLSSEFLYTIPVGLQKFQIANSSNYSAIMAGTTVSLLPIILLFVFAQKYFVESIAASGIKG